MTEHELLEFLGRSDYRPLPQRELLHRLQVAGADRPAARRIIRRLLQSGRLARGGGGRLKLAVERPPQRPRRATRLVGVLSSSPAGLRVDPIDEGAPIAVAEGDASGGRDGDAVRVELLGGPSSDSRRGRVLEVLGHLGDPATDVKVVVARHDLPQSFPEDALEQAASLPSSPSADEIAGRTRFDDPPVVTIDGETAKDFDDGFQVSALPDGGFRLAVHIADVAHYVRPGTPLDDEARRRGTSVYFPGCVLPMFPEKISNGLCSLVPGGDRLVQSVTIDFASDGSVTGTRFDDGVIRSAARLTYTGVAAELEGARALASPVRSMIERADRLLDVLERRRRERGGIDFDLPEPQILLDVEGAMTGVTIEPRNRAHRMIEAFMIAANEAVAEAVAHADVFSLFRVHDPPDPAKLDALRVFVGRLGYDLDVAEAQRSALAVQRMLEAIDDAPERSIVAQVTLRSMSQARYAVGNAGHFGLGSTCYCHFTSPIRRYPDLVVHRSLRAVRSGSPASIESTELDELAASCSELERRAEAAERESLLRKKVAFVADGVGRTFHGVVTGVARFGLFIQLVESAVEGLLHVEKLGNEWFEYDEGALELRGSASGVVHRLGDRLSVVLVRVDRVRARIDLAPAEAGSRGRRRRRARGPGPE